MRKKRYWILWAILLVVVASLIFGEDENATKKVVEKKNATTQKKSEKEESDKQDSSKNETAKSTAIGKIQLRPLMNGQKTKRIGEYAFILSNKEMITKKNLIRFFKEDTSKIKEANFLIVDLQNGAGLHILKDTPVVTYGKYDKKNQTLSQDWETIFVNTETNEIKADHHANAPDDKKLFSK